MRNSPSDLCFTGKDDEEGEFCHRIRLAFCSTLCACCEMTPLKQNTRLGLGTPRHELGDLDFTNLKRKMHNHTLHCVFIRWIRNWIWPSLAINCTTKQRGPFIHHWRKSDNGYPCHERNTMKESMSIDSIVVQYCVLISYKLNGNLTLMKL